jgi:hypothetical protein
MLGFADFAELQLLNAVVEFHCGNLSAIAFRWLSAFKNYLAQCKN